MTLEWFHGILQYIDRAYGGSINGPWKFGRNLITLKLLTRALRSTIHIYSTTHICSTMDSFINLPQLDTVVDETPDMTDADGNPKGGSSNPYGFCVIA